jgi:hypothetical protein
MEKLVHSPQLIFNFKLTIHYDDYMIDQKHYDKLLLTLNYMKSNSFKKLESKYLDEEQMVEIHRWLGNNCYVEHRNFECESSTDIVTLDLFEIPEDSYENLLIFQTREDEPTIYNKLVMGNDYFGRGFVLVEDFEWNIYEIMGIDIRRKDMDMEQMEELSLNTLPDYDVINVIEAYEEIILL